MNDSQVNAAAIDQNVAEMSSGATLAYPVTAPLANPVALGERATDEHGYDIPGGYGVPTPDPVGDSWDAPSVQQFAKVLGMQDTVTPHQISEWAEGAHGKATYTPDGNVLHPIPGYSGNPTLDQARLTIHTRMMLVEVDGQFYFCQRDTSSDQGGGGGLVADAPDYLKAQAKIADVATAYVILGYLPPYYFTQFNGLKLDYNADTATVMAACRRSAQVVRDRAAARVQELLAFTEVTQNETRQRAEAQQSRQRA